MEWVSINEKQPEDGIRVLTYSDCYHDKPELAYRILDGQFVRICSEVTHWAQLESPPNKAFKPDALKPCDCSDDAVYVCQDCGYIWHI